MLDSVFDSVLDSLESAKDFKLEQILGRNRPRDAALKDEQYPK
jgi:hypothetical protein